MDRAGGYDEYEFVAEFYDYVRLHGFKNDVPFYLEFAKKSPGPILEIGCGTGRILIPTAQAGHEVLGLDLSDTMLDVCRKRIAELGPKVQARVELVHGDMRSFDLGRKFGLITTPFRGFQHLVTVEDQLSCLTAVRKHLADDGTFILDIFNPHMPYLLDKSRQQEVDDDKPFELPDGSMVQRRSRVPKVHLAEQFLDCELIYYVTRPDGSKHRLVHDFNMRYLFRYEAEHLLARAGLTVVDVFADFDKSPFGSKTPSELILICKKA